MGSRRIRFIRGFAGVGLVASLIAAPMPPSARADVALCGSYPTPSSDEQALALAPFAFDGVVVEGRVVDDPQLGGGWVSPLTFRVSRWIKGADSGRRIVLGSGLTGVRIWDGRYARLPVDVLTSYSTDVRIRFRGEIVAVPGQAWRVFGTNEDGVNFTCTNLLGSHPIGVSESRVPSSAQGIPSPSASSRSRGHRDSGVPVAILLGAGVLALVGWGAALRLRASRHDP